MIGGSRRLAALLATVLVASPALAQRKAPSEKDKQLAGELVKRAIARSKAGDHDAAIAIYQQAYATVASSALLSNIGAEYQQVGKPKEALRYFCLYLEKDPLGANASYATTQAKLLQSQISNRLVDDAELCVSPKVEPSEPVAPVVGPDPPTTNPTEPSVLVPSQPVEVEPARGNPVLTYTGVGVAAAGLVAAGLGFYYGAQAQKISDELSAHPISDPWVNVQDRQRDGQHNENLQIGFLVAGGVLAASGVVMFALGRSSSAPEPTDPGVVRVVPTSNGVAVRGRF
jgi:tetratricopeptide (TPR) repeat protein